MNAMEFLNGRAMVLRGDITQQTVTCIVNAANRTLLGGGGVDGAIHRAGGPTILEACRELRRKQYLEGLPTGEAVLTTAGRLPAQYVIHTVGPVYGSYDGREADFLAACYRNSLAAAARHQCRTIAFPAISTGAFGYPGEEAAAIASTVISESLAMDSVIEEVRLVFFDKMDLAVFVDHHRFKA
jgi:O-acetyl-ADP-ribose deacetylase